MERALVKSRPNIIVILADDLGAWAPGCAGNREAVTPNIDRLAAEGTRFDRFYATSPACSPARATLLTGMIPSRHGIHDWLSGGNIAAGTDPAIRYLDGTATYTQVLAESGYTCGLSGVWHLGDSATPQQGFSHWFTLQDGSGPAVDAPMIRDGVPLMQPGSTADAITDDALGFMNQHRFDLAPFYLGIHYPCLHVPWPGGEPHVDPDLDVDFPFASVPREPIHPWSVGDLAAEPGSPKWRAQLHGYFAAITAMDAGIGRILRRLDDLDIAGDTIVWFLSDHGFNAGHHGVWGAGNGTFPLNMLDTSLRVPAIVRYPGTIPPGVVRREMLGAYDFAPTLLDGAGLKMPDAERLPGRSFACLLDPAQEPDRDHVVVMAEYGPVRMIQTPAWKYVHRFPYGPHELYDMTHDPGERSNLVDDPVRKEIVTLLRGEMQRWFSRYADPSLDGAHEEVTGSGQFLRAGTSNDGVLAYGQSRRPARDPAERWLTTDGT